MDITAQCAGRGNRAGFGQHQQVVGTPEQDLAGRQPYNAHRTGNRL